jgi:hypothetical protein
MGSDAHNLQRKFTRLLELECHDFPNFPDERKTEAMCLKQVEKNGVNLLYVPDRLKTYEMCKIAVTDDFCAFQCVPVKLLTPELFYIAQKQASERNQLKFFKSLDIYKTALNALSLDPSKGLHVEKKLVSPKPKSAKTSNISSGGKINWLERIDKDWREIYHVPKNKRTLEMYNLAYRKDKKALNDMPKNIRIQVQINNINVENLITKVRNKCRIREQMESEVVPSTDEHKGSFSTNRLNNKNRGKVRVGLKK